MKFVHLKAQIGGQGILKKIIDACWRVAQRVKSEFGVYDARVGLELRDDTYWLMFSVRGSSGTASYETPAFKLSDVEFGYLTEHDVEEYRDYCSKILDKLAELATEEY